MSKFTLNYIRLALATAVSASSGLSLAIEARAQINVTGQDGNTFMEETVQPVFKKPKPKTVTQEQINDLGVPVTPDGRIVPLKSDDGPVMGRGSQLEVTSESIYTPGAYYPGIPGWNPYGSFNPYWAPPMVPGTILPNGYSPYGYPGGANLNINIGGGAGLNFSTGGNYYNPYAYGASPYLSQWGSPYLAPSPYGGRNYLPGVPTIGNPGTINMPGLPSIPGGFPRRF